MTSNHSQSEMLIPLRGQHLDGMVDSDARGEAGSVWKVVVLEPVAGRYLYFQLKCL